MKKILALLLIACMVLPLTVFSSSAEVPNYITDAENYLEDINSSANLALNKSVTSTTALDEGAGNNWTPSNLTDGTLNQSGNAFQGFHSNHPDTKNHQVDAQIDLGSVQMIDTVVVYPGQDEDYTGVTLGMPNAYAVDVSNDGNEWFRVYSIYSVDNVPAAPVTIEFEAVEARYVKFVGISLNKEASGGFYMKLSEICVYYTNHGASLVPYSVNIAAHKPYTVTAVNGNNEPATAAHNAPNDNWAPENLNDGDRYNMITNTAYNDYGQYAGFHSGASGVLPTKIWYTLELGEGSTFNQIVIYPGTQKYATNHQISEFNVPSAFSFLTSNDGENFTTVKEVTGFSITEYGAIIINLDSVATAKYLQFYISDFGGNTYIKLSELEVYDTTKTVMPANPEKPTIKFGTNLALNADVISNAWIPNGSWKPALLTNGTLEADGCGYTSYTVTSEDEVISVAIDLGEYTRVNTMKLFSAQSVADDYVWTGIPQTFDIQCSQNGVNWTTVKHVELAEIPSVLDGQTYTFETTVTRYIRIRTTGASVMGKPSDNGRRCVQLDEMEVYYNVNTIEGYVQTRDGATADTFDARFLFEGDEAYITSLTTAKVALTFKNGSATVKTCELNLPDDIKIYKSILAGTDTYTPQTDCAIFGAVVIGIPTTAVTSVTATVTVSDNVIFIGSALLG